MQMIVELVSDSDPDMRALGLQQVREEAPGEAATKRFTSLLSELPPDAQAGLLEALGDRKDAAARPAVLEMLDSQEEAVRAAALGALGALGAASDVPILAGKIASGCVPVRFLRAANQGLRVHHRSSCSSSSGSSSGWGAALNPLGTIRSSPPRILLRIAAITCAVLRPGFSSTGATGKFQYSGIGDLPSKLSISSRNPAARSPILWPGPAPKRRNGSRTIPQI